MCPDLTFSLFCSDFYLSINWSFNFLLLGLKLETATNCILHHLINTSTCWFFRSLIEHNSNDQDPNNSCLTCVGQYVYWTIWLTSFKSVLKYHLQLNKTHPFWTNEQLLAFLDLLTLNSPVLSFNYHLVVEILFSLVLFFTLVLLLDVVGDRLHSFSSGFLPISSIVFPASAGTY